MTGGLKKISRYLLASAGVIGIFVAAPEAKAQSQQDLQQIQAQIQQMQATIQALQKQVADAKAQAAAANATAASAGGDIDLKVKWKGAPELSSADGKFKMKVRGRLEADYNSVNQDRQITTFPDVDATELRRARLGVEGILWYDWKYVFEVDFANDVTRVKDAYLQWQGWKVWDDPLLFRVGNFKTFNTFEDETSDRFVDTMERAAFINAWDIDRQIGASTMYYTDHYGLAAGIFGQRAGGVNDAPLFAGFTGGEDVTFAARAFAAPINREVNSVPQVLFFGASVRDRQAGNDQPFFIYGPNARGADLHLANAPIRTGNIGDEDTFWGLEAAGLWGPFAIQGKYAQLDVDLPGGTLLRSSNSGPGIPHALNPFIGVGDPTFTGWYVEGSWFFGGHKTYEEDGRWGRPKVNNPMFHGSGGWGALQIVGKYDVLEMGDVGHLVDAGFQNTTPANLQFVGACGLTNLFPGVGPQNPGGGVGIRDHPVRLDECGDMKTWVVGVNWWMTEYMRLMFQYSQSDLSDFVRTPAEPGTNTELRRAQNGFDDATIKGFGMRMQVDW